MSSKNSNLDSRMKAYEPKDKFMSRLPVIARLDGRSFSKFTKPLEKPYSEKFGQCMQKTAEYMCRKFNATLVHTQSDEITMLFDYTETDQANMFAGGRVFKLDSLLAAAATGKFLQMLTLKLPGYICWENDEEDLPQFDCRSYQLPNKAEATNVFLWRAQDCVRNSVQMLARANYSHAQCQNKSVKELLTMLDQDDINWADYPDHFREGSYYRRVNVEVHSEHTSKPVIRTRTKRVPYHKFSSYVNRESVVFANEEPRTERQGQDLLNGIAPFSA